MPLSARIFILLLSCLFAIAVSQQIKESDYRLPLNIDSIGYKITLKPDLKSSTFSGTLVFLFKSLKTTHELILNSKDLKFVDGSVRVYDVHGNEVPVEIVEEDKQLERLYIKTLQPLEKGKTYELNLNYSGIIYEEGVGLYYSDYKDEYGNNERMIVSQLRPVHARRVFPCLDEPAFRAHFRIGVIHAADVRAVSNMPVHKSTQLTHGLVLTEFEETPPMPAFLVALIVSKLPEIEGLGGFFGMATPDNFEGIKYSAEIGPKLASAMQAVTQIIYPLNKTHQVALPKLIPVAMENWGLYNFKEGNILYVEGVSPTVQKQTAARFSGHEVCHAWMGNMVSLGWWDYLWMSEVFAMYYEYLLPHMVDECWRMEEQMVIDLHQSGLLGDSVPVAPLTTKVLTPQEISNKFSGVTYTKGPGILRMAMHILGHENYLKGFRKLLLDLAYKNVPDPDTLWSYLSSYANRLPADLATIMSQWTVSSGYPVVNVAVSKDKIVLSQSKFALDEKEAKNISWWIPLTYTTETECDFTSTKPKDWFSPEQKMLTLNAKINDEDWVIFNIQSAGFYRVNYDIGNWERIVRQLYEGHGKIIPLNRAQLVDDSLNLARAGRLPYQLALSLVGYLSYEVDFIPWRSGIRAFSYLQTVLQKSSVEDQFRAYLAGLVSWAFEKIGWEEQSCDDHTTKINREEIVRLACESDVKECVDKSSSYVQNLINGHPQRISVDVRQTALCTAVRVGDFDTWSAIRSLYESSTEKDSKSYLAALTCKSHLHYIQRFLLESLKKSTVNQWNAEFSSFASRASNAPALLSLLKVHRDQIEQRIGKSKFSDHLKTISQFLTTEQQAKVLDELIVSGVDNLQGSRDSLADTLMWRRKFLPKIESFFNQNRQHSLIFSE